VPGHTFTIHINRRAYKAEKSPLTGLEILALAGFGADYELFQIQGEGDAGEGVLIPHEAQVELKDGMHFRAIPGNATFGHCC
jgi:hypothetical protein